MSYFAELAINGALVGLMYALTALGIVLVFKTSGVANLAQGALAMVGGYVMWWFAAALGAPLWLAVPLSLVVMFGVGRGIERVALRRMVGQPVIMIIMLTLGVEILLRGAAPALWVRWSSASTSVSRSVRSCSATSSSTAPISGAAWWRWCSSASRFCSSPRGKAWYCAPLPTIRRPPGRSASASSAPSACPGGSPVSPPPAPASCGARCKASIRTLSLLLIKALAVAILGGLDSIGGVLVAGIAVGVLENVIPGYVDPLVGEARATSSPRR